MIWSLYKGALIRSHAGRAARLAVRAVAAGGAPAADLELFDGAGFFWSDHPAGRVELHLAEETESQGGRTRFRLLIKARAPLRIELRLELAQQSRDAWHILPGFIFGDNNFSVAGAGHFPVLSRRNAAGLGVSPCWQTRAERCAAPLAMAFGEEGGHVAIAAAPCAGLEGAGDTFLRNGLIAELPAAVGLAVGCREAPLAFIDKDIFGAPAEQLVPAGAVVVLPVDLFFRGDSSRRVAHALVREVYALYHEPPAAEAETEECIDAVAAAAVADGRQDGRAFRAEAPAGRRPGAAPCLRADAAGLSCAVLAAAARRRRTDWRAVARRGMDRAAADVNPATGLFRIAGGGDGSAAAGLRRDLHFARASAETAWHLLRGSLLEIETGGAPAPEWHRPALAACDAIIGLQRADGHCGYAYRRDRPAVADWEGFAGCWWAAAFCEACRLTGRRRYLEAARRAVACYWPQVRQLDVWGTALDACKTNDEEGGPAFVLAARRLHELTGEDECLDMLAAGAEYEFLWRYLHNVRPAAEAPPGSAGRYSCGASLVSVARPVIHSLGLLIADDLKYLAERSGDGHFLSRLEDSLVWARNCLGRFPAKSGLAAAGPLFGPQAAGAVLEGLLAVTGR